MIYLPSRDEVDIEIANCIEQLGYITTSKSLNNMEHIADVAVANLGRLGVLSVERLFTAWVNPQTYRVEHFWLPAYYRRLESVFRLLIAQDILSMEQLQRYRMIQVAEKKIPEGIR